MTNTPRDKDQIADLQAAVDACKKAKNTAPWSDYLDGLTRPDKENLGAYIPDVIDILLRLRTVVGGTKKADDFLNVIRSLRAEHKAKEAGLRVVSGEDPDPWEQPADTIQLPVPAGYVVGSSGIWRRLSGPEGGMVLVARRWIGFTAIFVNKTTGERHFDMAWEDGHTIVRRAVPRGVVADMRAIVQLAKWGAPITSKTAGDVVTWLADLEIAALDKLPCRRSASSLGWQDGGGFMWGETPIGAEAKLIVDDGQREVASGFRAAGDYVGWLSAWTWAVSHPRMALAVVAAVAPAVLGVLPAEASGFVVDWSGRTSGGKTSTLQLAASVFGDPGRLVYSWDTSLTGLERLAALSRHLPTILDDTKRARNNGEDVATAIYMVTGTRGGLRALPDGLRTTASIRTVLLSTGEAPATSFTQDGGTRARVLAIQGYPLSGGDTQENRATVEAIQAIVAEHHGHIGPMVVKWLEDNRDQWPEIRKRWVEARKGVVMAGGPGARSAGYLATLSIAVYVLEVAAGLAIPESVLIEARTWAEASVRDADRPLAAMRSVMEIAAIRGKDMLPYDKKAADVNRLLGVYQRDHAPAFFPQELAHELAKEGIKLDEVRSEWASRKWIHVTEGVPRKQFRINDKRQWLLALTPAGVDAANAGASGDAGDSSGDGDLIDRDE